MASDAPSAITARREGVNASAFAPMASITGVNPAVPSAAQKELYMVLRYAGPLSGLTTRMVAPMSFGRQPMECVV